MVAAGVYNLVYGAATVLFPGPTLTWLIGPEEVAGAGRIGLLFWSCIGMIVGVYGVGYLIAARDPRRHWPIVLVGFLGKLFGPIGFVWGVATAQIPPGFGLANLTNDVIWWLPFGVILWRARLAQAHDAPEDAPPAG